MKAVMTWALGGINGIRSGSARIAQWWQALSALDRNLLLILGASILLISATLAIWQIPQRQLAPLKAKIQRERQSLQPNERLKLEHDARKLENDARTTVVQAMGGAVLLIGLLFTWRSIRATERNLQITQETAASNLMVAMDGHITERFTRAIEHLGNKQHVVRLGAIYTLEQIAWPPVRDSSLISIGHRWPIMEILTAYVRARAPWPPTAPEPATDLPPKPDPDIQAILTVLGRRTRPYGSYYAYVGIGGPPPNLCSTNLRGADLTEARLEEALLQEVHLEHANLQIAHLEKAKLIKAHLEGADLTSACLKEADLFGAYLEKANLSGTDFEGAVLSLAHLEGQLLIGTHLEGANLFGAHLQGATFRDTHLKGAILRGTHLEGARDLTAAQLAEVKTLCEAHLDSPLREQAQQRYPHLFEEPQDSARISYPTRPRPSSPPGPEPPVLSPLRISPSHETADRGRIVSLCHSSRKRRISEGIKVSWGKLCV